MRSNKSTLAEANYNNKNDNRKLHNRMEIYTSQKFHTRYQSVGWLKTTPFYETF